MHASWRDCKAWSDLGLRMTGGSDEACKLYDAALTQYIGWYSIPDACGGLDACVATLSTEFPDFAMGQVMATDLQLISTGCAPRLDPSLQRSLANLEALSLADETDRAGLTTREKLHCCAAAQLGKGNMSAACQLWEEVLVDHPNDALALKLAHDCYFYTGRQRQLRDSIARVLPSWKPADPLYGNILGFYAFGLMENRDYNGAESLAKKALEINQLDGWSSHTLAHVYEMTGRQDEGLQFMAATEHQWEFSNLLSGHNHWHTSLFHIEKGEYEEALTIYDTKVKPRLSSGQLLDIIDSTSLLYRMQLEGVDIGPRWHGVIDHCLPHLDDHVTAFNDLHLLMACLGTQNPEHVDKAMASTLDYLREGTSENWHTAKALGQPLAEAMIAFDSGNYSKAADILLPLHYEVIHIGGSDAQRDLFSQLLLQSCLRSPARIKYARWLLNDRKALKPNSPLTDRLIARSLQAHDEL